MTGRDDFILDLLFQNGFANDAQLEQAKEYVRANGGTLVDGLIFVKAVSEDDVIGMLARVFLQPGDEVIVPQPSFLMYEIMTQAADAVVRKVPLRDLCIDLDAVAGAVGSATRMIFLCNPNNPTGTIFRRRASIRG